MNLFVMLMPSGLYIIFHSGRTATIQVSNYGSGVCMEHYT